jgi:Bacterial Ig domain
VTYWLGVGPVSGQGTGPFVLSWTIRRPPPPPNDDFVRAQEIFGRHGDTVGSNPNASKEPGEPNHAGEPGGGSIWFRWTAPMSGRAIFHTMGSDAGSDTVLAVYTGSTVGSLTLVASDADSGLDDHSSRLGFTASAGVTYSIAIDTVAGRETNLATCRGNGMCGDLRLRWNSGSSPPNDAFVSARTISGDSGFFWAENVGARRDTGEPSHAEDASWPYPLRGGASVWFRWVAPSSGEAVFSAESEDFNPLIAAYQGSSVGALTTVAENDFRSLEPGGINRGVSFDAVKGQTYVVAVDAEFEGTGHFTFTWASRPVNDAFVDARLLTSTAGRILDSNGGATREDAAGEPDHEGLEGVASIWYAWTPPQSGPAVVDTIGLDGEFHRLAVYTGGSVGALTPVAATEFLNGGARRVSFTANAGTTYRIALDSPLFGTGFELNWRVGNPESTAPTVSLSGPADGAQIPGLITWGATASDASGIAWVQFLVDDQPVCIDDTAPYACTWSNNFYGADSPVEIGARAVDAFGNTAGTPTRTVLGDSGPPSLLWQGEPTDLTPSSSATFDVAVLDRPLEPWQCSLGETNFSRCTLPVTYTGLGTGGHYWRGRTTDPFGLANSWPASFLWEIVGPDRVAPGGSVAIDGGAAATRSPTVALELLAWDVDSAVDRVRVSNSPTTTGGLLNKARETAYVSGISWNVTDQGYGGTPADGTKAVYVQFRDAAGNWSPVKTDSIVLDRVAPAAGSPVDTIPTDQTLGTSSVIVRLSWTGTDDRSGVARYELQRSVSGGAWTAVTLPSDGTTSIERPLALGTTYRYRVRAVDRAGNIGSWATGPFLTPARRQESSTSITYAGAWSSKAVGEASGGYVARSIDAGARATIRFSGHAIAWVGVRGANRGIARVYVGDALVATIDLADASTRYRQVVFSRRWTTSAERFVSVVVAGTHDRPAVDIDAFVVLP